MNLSQAEYFLTVAEKKSFTLAAKSLYISQPALSKQISLLEQELGIKLLIRNNKMVCLTEAGKAFQSDLQNIMEHLTLAKERAVQIGNQTQKQIRISCFDGVVMDDFLPDILKNIRQIIPEIQIDLERGNFKDIRQQLIDHDTDLIFTLDFEQPSLHSYRNKCVAKRKGALIYSDELERELPEKPVISDFKDQTFLMVGPAVSSGGYHYYMMLLRQLGLGNVKVKFMKDMMTLLAYLEMGGGVSILDQSVPLERTRLRMLPVDGVDTSMNVIGVWDQENTLINSFMCSDSL